MVVNICNFGLHLLAAIEDAFLFDCTVAELLIIVESFTLLIICSITKMFANGAFIIRNAMPQSDPALMLFVQDNTQRKHRLLSKLQKTISRKIVKPA